jgi:peptidoglycan/xylan/chitin deacetylase (PgdA/CDA1 family)
MGVVRKEAEVIDHVEPAVDWILAHGPAQTLFRARLGRGAIVLAYHGIDRSELFQEHFKFLLRHYRPISLADLVAACRRRNELPRRAVLLSFDDGDKSLIDIVLPLFREHGIPGIAFVIAGLLESNQVPWWSDVEGLLASGGTSPSIRESNPAFAIRALKKMPEVDRQAAVKELRASASTMTAPADQLTEADLRTLEAGGIAIGNHTSTHPCLTRCTTARVETEIREAHAKLESSLGHPPTAFAYPNGDWDPRAERVLEELGYEAAFLFDHRTSPRRIADPLRISRLRVDSSTTIDRFRMIVSGLHPALHRLRGGK